jgi:hypothetical protein
MFKKLFADRKHHSTQEPHTGQLDEVTLNDSTSRELTPELEAELADENYPDSPPLLSARGTDYRFLRSYLAQEQWKKADQETVRVLLQTAQKSEQGWLSSGDLAEFPCQDLATIDQLWVHYSRGQCGFSVQTRLWLDCGGVVPEEDYEAYKKFAELVGWRKKGEWLFYDKLIFNVDRSPRGHLPSFRRAGGREMIFFRMITCRLCPTQSH